MSGRPESSPATFEEIVAKVLSVPEMLSRCVLGLKVRKGGVERVVERPVACYHLYRGYLIDHHGTQIPLHRIACLSCAGIGRCTREVSCEVYRSEWAWAVVCPCDGGKAVRGPRGYDPVYALSGPPYPLVSNGEVIGCLPEGECKGSLIKRDVWYWYY